MAAAKRVEARAGTSAPPETVWALLADAQSWSDWGPWEERADPVPGWSGSAPLHPTGVPSPD